MRAFFVLLIATLGIPCVFASALSVPPLPADQAFVFSATPHASDVQLDWQMAPGDYLYQNRLAILPAAGNQASLGKMDLPKPDQYKYNSIAGRYGIYKNHLKITLPFEKKPSDVLALTVHYQGCSERGFCYSPMEKEIRFENGNRHSTEQIFLTANFFMLVLSFMGLGLLLAFTPCVLPMVPILSSIIVGRQKQHPGGHAFGLSLAYVLGMAIAYAAAGLITAWAGSRIQTILQAPWAIIILSGLFVLLALFLWGVITIRGSSAWATRMTSWSNRLPGGSLVGVFAMGVVSSLIVSPCISPAMVGVLAYIANAGDLYRGAWALFSLGLGMGIPLLLVGASCHRWLPTAGKWMGWVEKIAGAMLFGVAVMLMARIMPAPLLVSHAPFSGITRMSEFDAALAKARQNKKSVILDFYADWCIECVTMQRDVFSTLTPQQKANFIFLQDNITHNTHFDRALMQRFHVIAPPTIVFFSSDGQEQESKRIIGGLNKKEWLSHLR